MSNTRRGFFVMSALAGATLATWRLADWVSAQAQSAPQATTQDLRRAEDLLRQMTLEEKAMQLSSMFPMALIGTDGLLRD
ncbi:MAG: hypothetical protein KIT80_18180 [Chitinophagaceae bacterium]|nr:hypothetical protein [Chitinophagaceae bacterium]